jgi:hypothetical protein
MLAWIQIKPRLEDLLHNEKQVRKMKQEELRLWTRKKELWDYIKETRPLESYLLIGDNPVEDIWHIPLIQNIIESNEDLPELTIKSDLTLDAVHKGVSQFLEEIMLDLNSLLVKRNPKEKSKNVSFTGKQKSSMLISGKWGCPNIAELRDLLMNLYILFIYEGVQLERISNHLRLATSVFTCHECLTNVIRYPTIVTHHAVYHSGASRWDKHRFRAQDNDRRLVLMLLNDLGLAPDTDHLSLTSLNTLVCLSCDEMLRSAMTFDQVVNQLAYTFSSPT